MLFLTMYFDCISKNDYLSGVSSMIFVQDCALY